MQVKGWPHALDTRQKQIIGDHGQDENRENPAETCHEIIPPRHVRLAGHHGIVNHKTGKEEKDQYRDLPEDKELLQECKLIAAVHIMVHQHIHSQKAAYAFQMIQPVLGFHVARR